MVRLVSGLVIFVASPALAGVDSDGDGFSAATDCDDNDARVFPGAYEACNGVDDDCDGIIDDNCNPGTGTGTGGSGYTGYTGTSTGNPARDADGDGYAEGDCDDQDPLIFPGAYEACNGVDDDCDGIIDEDCGTEPPPEPDTGTATDPTTETATDDPSTDRQDEEDEDTGVEVESKGLGCTGTGGSYAWIVLLPLLSLAGRRRWLAR